jgi:hypothetical protein
VLGATNIKLYTFFIKNALSLAEGFQSRREGTTLTLFCIEETGTGCEVFLFFFFNGATDLVGQGLLFIEAPRSHSVELLWISDQPDSETCT